MAIIDVPKIKTKFEDHDDPNCERREYKVLHRYDCVGRSSVTFHCPWCNDHIEAFIWSICGGGKRCECGAIFGGSGTGYKLMKKRTKKNER